MGTEQNSPIWLKSWPTRPAAPTFISGQIENCWIPLSNPNDGKDNNNELKEGANFSAVLSGLSVFGSSAVVSTDTCTCNCPYLELRDPAENTSPEGQSCSGKIRANA